MSNKVGNFEILQDWRISTIDKRICIVSAEDVRIICSIPKDGWIEEDRMSRAKLICAAPEMLGALKEVANGMVCVCKLNPYAGKEVPCRTCRLNAVIARAEGRL